MSYYRDQLEEWLRTIPVKAEKVIDIGGAQNPVKGRTWSWDVKEYEILDLPEYNLEKLPSESWEHPKADIIFCLEVFEYLIHPYVALMNIKDILNSDGRAFVTFAFAYPHHNELMLDALRYTEPGIRRLAEEVGLFIKNIWYRVDKSGLLQGFYSADGMHPSKDYHHHNVTGFIVEFIK